MIKGQVEGVEKGWGAEILWFSSSRYEVEVKKDDFVHSHLPVFLTKFKYDEDDNNKSVRFDKRHPPEYSEGVSEDPQEFWNKKE